MMENRINALQKARQAQLPTLPLLLQDVTHVALSKDENTIENNAKIDTLFPLTFGQPLLHGKKGGVRKPKPLLVGVVFSGGQASGGHNVIIGIHDALQKLDRGSRLFGFLDGPGGIIAGKYKELQRNSWLSFATRAVSI